ncbi:MAG TPA: nuclear transport factor 2 family protein [Microthrixaceae bacterium]|nr:nuclear transport factor 2 family protein [Microthrixaceae bacterium]
MGQTLDVAEQFFERFGAGDIDGAMACFDPDCISITPSGPLNVARHHAAAQALKNALPDSHMELVRIVESGDEVYVTGRFKGTHVSDLATPLGTIAGSGKKLDLLFVDYFRVLDGKIVECEAVRDRLDMILQLGGVPSTNPSRP